MFELKRSFQRNSISDNEQVTRTDSDLTSITMKWTKGPKNDPQYDDIDVYRHKCIKETISIFISPSRRLCSKFGNKLFTIPVWRHTNEENIEMEVISTNWK